MADDLKYRYETLEVGELEVHLRSLRDAQEFQADHSEIIDYGISDAQWSLFGVLWPAGYILASLMERRPNITNIKILEVGCGLALSSIVLKIRGADITATDYNPAVEAFLVENSRINKCEEVPFIRADWEDEHLVSGERYDLIIGSDLLYQRIHPEDLSHFINKSAKDRCEVIIVDPNRGNQNNFSREMLKNNFVCRKDSTVFLDRYFRDFKGSVNYYTR